jgi:probable rRNA maturation factor
MRARRRGVGALRVTISDERGLAVRARGLAAWLRRVAPARARGSIHIALVSDARMRALNAQFRGKNQVTDVLSFPNHLTTNPQSPIPNHLGDLGEIVVARGVARRQARSAGHSEPVELRVLALHGLLHLLGYDHERDNGEMRRVEQRLRRVGGLPDGLIERTHR